MTTSPIAKDLAAACSRPAPELLLAGIAQFNAGQFYECHETLEIIWRAETGPARELYQGILQVGVGCHHALRGNQAGAAALLRRGIRRLEALPDVCQGLLVGRLVKDAAVVLAGLEAGRSLTVAACPRVGLA